MQQRLLRIGAFALAIAALASAACGPAPPPDNGGTSSATAPSRGGELVVSVRTEPRSFSWYLQHDATTQDVTFLTQARLVRVNRATWETEPWLAESWTRSEDGLRYTIKLRPNITFADGHPFTADDVVFSLAAAYDPKAGGPVMADTMMVAGKPISAAASGPDVVVVTFPAPFGPGLRLFDNLPMLPKHKLEGPLEAGRFAEVLSVSTPPAELTGLGPFVLTEFLPGQRLVFARNERYFRKDANGVQLPYLDRIVLEIVRDQDSQMLRIETGQADMTNDEARPEDYGRLRRARDAGRIQLFELGMSMTAESLWFNLKPGAFGSDPRAAWLQREELRHAISHAVDRKLFADTVYFGAAVPVFGPITPANRKWHAELPPTPHDPARARALLASIGLTDRNLDGTLEDAKGGTARFSLSIQKGRSSHERAAAVIRDELKKVGLVVDVVPLEGNALVQRLATGQGYEAGYFQLTSSDTDHALNQEYWLSDGGAHLWHLGQKSPATEWEKRIDELMAKNTMSLDDAERKKAFDEVQRVFAEHLPMIHFAAPLIFVPVSARVGNLTPAVLRPQLLWWPDAIAVKH